MTPRALDISAGITGGGAIVAWFAETLPVLQWTAAAIAIVVGSIAIYKNFRR